jgi:glycerophosphoryl diester phosphodiesterase
MAVLDVVRRTGAIDRVCVGSFHAQGLAALRAAEPALATSASEPEAKWTLYRAWCRWPFSTRQPYCAFQVPERSGRRRVVSRAFIAQAHRAGARVDVWVVDRPEDIARLFSWGVDGVITDRPDLAVGTRDEWMRRVHHVATK